MRWPSRQMARSLHQLRMIRQCGCGL
ncbi:hypothetical protein CKAH01_10730 [Colletotrichum kahawae]|uniref:Uncharacterized protein n=1 Tax=Colletotrichum kahawae TaxID=34407 RepID=A0AAD9XY01_COLKA|nr:hypothetical protein CKAH01_10730 [Colletotrichum kahawae]